jgi:hypothetical protein
MLYILVLIARAELPTGSLPASSEILPVGTGEDSAQAALQSVAEPHFPAYYAHAARFRLVVLTCVSAVL